MMGTHVAGDSAKIAGFHENHGARLSKVDFGGITREGRLE